MQNDSVNNKSENASTDNRFGYVELGRTFHEQSQHSRESDEFDLSEGLHVRGGIGWGEVLKNYRTVILSEAGSGKTEEIKATALKLKSEGKQAFFLRLENIPDDFDDAFEIGTAEEFKDWLASEDEAWLLLDSVDEARLGDPRDFEKAVRKLGKKISTASQRAHIVLTGRTYAWRAKSDPAMCESNLPFGNPEGERAVSIPAEENDDLDDDFESENVRPVQPKSFLKVLGLDDLSPDQVEVFAKSRGVANTDAFRDAIERADAWSFTGRPQDLQEVIEFWLEEGRIGTRIEIMRKSIERRLISSSGTMYAPLGLTSLRNLKTG
jgi:hypothetical protein